MALKLIQARFWRRLSLIILGSLLGGCQVSHNFNVRNFGATGDGQTLDTPAINDAISAAAAAGGGTVDLPAGNYLCYSIHLKSHITLYLDQGATIVAAGTALAGQYDPPEYNPFDHYQDFGHTHWHNSLIWGEGIHDVAIEGPGMIYGKGLSRGQGTPSLQPSPTLTPRELSAFKPAGAPGGFGGPRLPSHRLETLYNYDDRADVGPTILPGTTQPSGDQSYPNSRDSLADGIGNKSISLKWCYNVTLRDISILQGGHFGILASAVDNFTIDNLKIDTNRDGMDIDNCKNVRVSNCSVNSPQDDGICLKSSFGIGVVRPCENITITNCYVTGGYVVGALIDGTLRKLLGDYAPGMGAAIPTPPAFGAAGANGQPSTRPVFRPATGPGRTGRIKFGTESNGGFINIAISNCVFDDCQGLAIETVDGGPIEDVSIDNITMRNIVSVPIFIRLGNRARGPFAPVGVVRHINISNIVCENLASRYACIISGIPGHPIEDVRISNVRISYPGDKLPADATTRPAENERSYPEPTMFRAVPAYGFYIRHVKDIELDNIKLSTVTDDVRPPFFLDDVDGADFVNIKAPHADGVATFHLSGVKNFNVRQSLGIADASRDSAEDESF
jgi:polygalacturonase